MKAFTVDPKSKIHVYSEAVSMSYGFPRLTEIVKKKLKADIGAGSEDLYVFCNKAQNYLKVLYWSKGGYCLHCKKLPKGTFDIDNAGAELTFKELTQLVDHVIVHGGKSLRHLEAA